MLYSPKSPFIFSATQSHTNAQWLPFHRNREPTRIACALLYPLLWSQWSCFFTAQFTLCRPAQFNPGATYDGWFQPTSIPSGWCLVACFLPRPNCVSICSSFGDNFFAYWSGTPVHCLGSDFWQFLTICTDCVWRSHWRESYDDTWESRDMGLYVGCALRKCLDPRWSGCPFEHMPFGESWIYNNSLMIHADLMQSISCTGAGTFLPCAVILYLSSHSHM